MVQAFLRPCGATDLGDYWSPSETLMVFQSSSSNWIDGTPSTGPLRDFSVAAANISVGTLWDMNAIGTGVVVVDSTMNEILGGSTMTSSRGYTIVTTGDFTEITNASTQPAISSIENADLKNIQLRNGNTYLYAMDTGQDQVLQYTLGTADSFQGTLTEDDVGAIASGFDCIHVDVDGDWLVALNPISDAVNIYSMSPAFDISTVSLSTTGSTATYPGSFPRSILADATGDTLWIFDDNGFVYQYSMSTAWDASTLSYDSVSLDLGRGDATNQAQPAFRSSGTVMLMSGYDLNDTNFAVMSIGRYSLSTANDPTSATLVDHYDLGVSTDARMAPDGNSVYVRPTGSSVGVIYQYPLGTKGDLSTIDLRHSQRNVLVTSNDISSNAYCMSYDGRYMYYFTQTDDKVYSVPLSTPYDLSTGGTETSSAALTATITNAGELWVVADGSNIYIAPLSGTTTYRFNMSTPWDVTTLSYASDSYNSSGINATLDLRFVDPDGSALYFWDSSAGLARVPLSTNNDLSTAGASVNWDPTEAVAASTPGYYPWFAINESSPSDADYIQSPDDPTAATCRYKLDAPQPAVDTTSNPVVRYRYAKSGAGTTAVTVRLKEGATTRASWTHSNISTTPVTQTQTLASTETSAVTDWNNLSLEFEFTVT